MGEDLVVVIIVDEGVVKNLDIFCIVVWEDEGWVWVILIKIVKILIWGICSFNLVIESWLLEFFCNGNEVVNVVWC